MWEGGATPGLVALVSKIKQAEQASKKHTSVASLSASFPVWLLPWLPLVDYDSGYVNQMNHFFPRLLWLLFHHHHNNPTKT